jgi:hypothetical protein
VFIAWLAALLADTTDHGVWIETELGSLLVDQAMDAVLEVSSGEADLLYLVVFVYAFAFRQELIGLDIRLVLSFLH